MDHAYDTFMVLLHAHGAFAFTIDWKRATSIVIKNNINVSKRRQNFLILGDYPFKDY